MGDDLVERQQAHWSLWIPYDSRESTIGTRIHVTGDALNGFKHEFDRRHDPATDDRRPRLIELGLIDSSHISPVGPVSNSEESHDHVIPRAYNELEQLALKIPAPGPSLRSSASNAVRGRVQVQNCQSWLRQLIGTMIEKGILAGEAQGVVDAAPQH